MIHPPCRAPSTPRDPWLDNARFVLIGLVLLGHAAEPLLGRLPALATLYRFIYLFHMPAFAFLSGAVTQARLDPPRWRAIVFRLLLPYVVFQGIYTLAALVPNWPDAGPNGIATPYWLLWYLLSLAAWRVLLPIFAHLRHPLWLALAVALLAGLASDVGRYLSLSRTLVLFPMFLLGWRHAGSWRAAGHFRVIRWLALATLLALLGLATSDRFDTQWLYGSRSYEALNATPLIGLAWRSMQLAAGVAGSFAVLALIPRRPTVFTGAGQHSMPAYLLHGLLLKLAVAAGFYTMLAEQLAPGLWLPAIALLALALAAWLSRPAASHLLAPVTTPRWLERRLWRQTASGQPG